VKYVYHILMTVGKRRKDMKTPNMEQRLRLLAEKVQTHYESLNSGYPYLYFVYDPDDENILPEIILKYFPSDECLSFAPIDLLKVSIESIEGDEEEREYELNDPMLASEARREIVQLWSEAISKRIVADVAVTPVDKRPVALLYGVAALHPLGTPTQLMLCIAEMEPRDERTGRAVPIVVFIPGFLSLRTNAYFYHFLDVTIHVS
jgi:hypothetical protein